MSNQTSTPYETILYEKKGSRATITLNRPERRNATTLRMYEEILAAAKAADKDPEVRVVILTGAISQRRRHTY